MSPLPVIANASPLIALAQIDRLELLRRLFQDVVIPPLVHGFRIAQALYEQVIRDAGES